MSELDLSKPVQVQDECGAWRELPSPRISYEDCNGTRYTLYASAARRLRNTPESEKQGEWRYFKLGSARFRVKDTGTDERLDGDKWHQTIANPWKLSDFLNACSTNVCGRWTETDADGNPLQPPPEPPREQTELQKLLDVLVKCCGGVYADLFSRVDIDAAIEEAGRIPAIREVQK